MGSYFALHICQYFTVMFDQQNNAIVCIGSPSIFRTVNPFYVPKKRNEKKQRYYVNVCRPGRALCCERLAQWLRFSSLHLIFSYSHSISLYQSWWLGFKKPPVRIVFVAYCWHIYSYLSKKRGDLFSCFFAYALFFLWSAFNQNI